MLKVHLAVQVFQGCLEEAEVHSTAAPAQAKVHQWNEEGEGKVVATYLEREVIFPQDDLTQLGLGPRVEKALLRKGITTMGRLAMMTKKELLYFRNIGNLGIAEIQDKLAARGLTLADRGGSLRLDQIEPRPTCQCEGNPKMFCVLDGVTGRLWGCERCPRVLYVSKVSSVATWFVQEQN